MNSHILFNLGMLGAMTFLGGCAGRPGPHPTATPLAPGANAGSPASNTVKIPPVIYVFDLAGDPRHPFLCIGSENAKHRMPGGLVAMNPYAMAAKFVLAHGETERDVKAMGSAIAKCLVQYIQGGPETNAQPQLNPFPSMILTAVSGPNLDDREHLQKASSSCAIEWRRHDSLVETKMIKTP